MAGVCRRRDRRFFGGYSLLEILVVLAVIGLVVTLVARTVKDTTGDAEIITALNQMHSIRAAVVEGFYPDFGFVPEEAHDLPGMQAIEILRNRNPEFVTRFLCFQKDCSPQDIEAALEKGWFFSLEKDVLEGGHPHCYYLAKALSHLVAQRQYYDFEKILPLLADPAVQRGWSGAYLEANSRFNATALNRQDDKQYHPDFYTDAAETDADVLFPVIASPWADRLEAAALEAEEDGDLSLAAERRRGRYYQILVCSRYVPAAPSGQPTESWGRWEQIPATAVVICRGEDGLPGPDAKGNAMGAEDHWKACEALSRMGLTEAQRACFDRLKITDPADPDYVDIGDDMLLFIFGDGPVRSPLEK